MPLVSKTWTDRKENQKDKYFFFQNAPKRGWNQWKYANLSFKNLKWKFALKEKNKTKPEFRLKPKKWNLWIRCELSTVTHKGGFKGGAPCLHPKLTPPYFAETGEGPPPHFCRNRPPDWLWVHRYCCFSSQSVCLPPLLVIPGSAPDQVIMRSTEAYQVKKQTNKKTVLQVVEL